MKRIKLKKSGYFFTALLFLAFFIAIYAVIAINKSPGKTVTRNLDEYAQQSVDKCSSSKYKSNCYDKEIPGLMDPGVNLSMEDAFEVARRVQKKDNSFVFCHVLGHKLSEKETAKDPSKWKEVISRCPSGVCSNGCIHGAFQEKFRNESLTEEEIETIKPELATICRSRDSFHPSGIEQGSCYHALGHLTMYMTAADTKKSVSLCKELAVSEKNKDYTSVCFDGVFMQIFQPLEPEDFALVKGITPTEQNIKIFCEQFGDKEKASCWGESWPLKLEKLKTAEGLVEFCSYLNGPLKSRCFDNMFYIMPIQFRFDTQKMLSYCRSMPSDISGKCAAQVALRYVQNDFSNIDDAVNFCRLSLDYDSDEKCFEILAKQASYNFTKGSEEYKKMCGSLPENWQGQCT